MWPLCAGALPHTRTSATDYGGEQQILLQEYQVVKYVCMSPVKSSCSHIFFKVGAHQCWWGLISAGGSTPCMQDTTRIHCKEISFVYCYLEINLCDCVYVNMIAN